MEKQKPSVESYSERPICNVRIESTKSLVGRSFSLPPANIFILMQVKPRSCKVKTTGSFLRANDPTHCVQNPECNGY